MKTSPRRKRPTVGICRVSRRKLIVLVAGAALGCILLARMGLHESGGKEREEAVLPTKEDRKANVPANLEQDPAMAFPDPEKVHADDVLRLLSSSVHRSIDDLIKLGPVASDDPQLVRLVRRLVFPPSRRSSPVKNSRKAFMTPQIEEVLKVFAQHPNGRTFVEAGALDGERSSNTDWLEQQRNWTGLLVEPDPFFFMQLLGRNRNSFLVHAGLSLTDHPSWMNFAGSVSGTGRLSASGSDKRILCIPLYTILLALDMLHVDFLSLDIEGDELNVLRTIPWTKVNISSLSVEIDHVEGGGAAAVERFMRKSGYRLRKRIFLNQPQNFHYSNDHFYERQDSTQS